MIPRGREKKKKKRGHEPSVSARACVSVCFWVRVGGCCCSSASVDVSHHNRRRRVEEPRSFFPIVNVFFQKLISFIDPFSYHNLEHGAEDLGVLRHAADVERPAEDRGVVVLITHLDEDFGRVGCKTSAAR